MSLTFGNVVFTLTNLVVARLLANGSYDTVSASLSYGSELSFEVESDNDELPAYGMIVELLSVVKKLNGTIKDAVIDPEYIYIVSKTSDVSSGATPDRTATLDYLAGGDGLPYFGAVGAFAGLNGANVLLGLRKCKLNTLPAWTVEMNKFKLADTEFSAVAINTSSRKLHRVRRYETAATIPADLNSFFA